MKIAEELGDMHGMGRALNIIGLVYSDTGNFDTTFKYYTRSLKIWEELGNKSAIGMLLHNIGRIYYDKGDLDCALDYYIHSHKIDKELGDKRGIGHNLNNIGIIYYYKIEYKKAEEYLKKSLAIQNEIGLKEGSLICYTTIYLYLIYKILSKKYNKKEIYSLIKEEANIDYNLNYSLYQLLEDTSYLKTAYNQVQEKVDNLEPDVAAKFLSYPIPKAIVEEWEKVTNTLQQ
jgi:tetratricopeptide (TPR) repeat protein